MLNENQQILEQINRAKEILIVSKENFSGDGLSSAIALRNILKKLDKKTDIVISNFNTPKNYNFLPDYKNIKSNLYHLKKFTIIVDTELSPVDELSYDKSQKELKIFLIPKTGTYSQKNISFSSSDYRYDLIFVLDSPDLESLGSIYEKNTDFFYNTPIINIDHSPANEYFGQINKVEITMTSTAEVIYSLLKIIGQDLLDENIATCIYTGMTEKTKSFKSPNVTPQTLNIASRLIQEGAEREKIITNLYRTKSVATLKLWGRALAKLQLEPKLKLAWTTLSQNDFDKTGAKKEQINGLVEEIISEMPQAEIVVIFSEEENKINIRVHTTPKINALGLIKKFSPQGNKLNAYFSIKNKRLAEIERETIEQIKLELEKIS